jgi:predicted nucleic acid-binding protein
MNRYLVDTNVLSEFGRPQQPHPKVKKWLEAADPRSFFASVVTWGNFEKELRASRPRNATTVWRNGWSATCATVFNRVCCR